MLVKDVITILFITWLRCSDPSCKEFWTRFTFIEFTFHFLLFFDLFYAYCYNDNDPHVFDSLLDFLKMPILAFMNNAYYLYW